MNHYIDFWANHGWLFLLGVTFFPRITLFLTGILPINLLGWLGYIFIPHVHVAIIATTLYWDTNPWLCIISWFVALAGTGGESTAVRNT